MAQAGFSRILIYKSDTATSIPVAGNLTNSATGAELAVNTADLRLFTKNSGGSVVELGTNPSSLTLPNGTANGVLYLNGSKVATSGSALTFDGTTLTSSALTVSGASTLGGSTDKIIINRLSDATAYGSVTFNGLLASTTMTGLYGRGSGGDSGSLFYTVATGTNHIWQIAGSEQMRLNSTGLGIGTASPNILSWNKVTTLNTATGNAAYEVAINGSAQAYFAADASNVYLAAYANKPLLIRTNNATVATFDTSGNLGLGVTPSASTIYPALEVGAGNCFVGASGSIDYTCNAFYNGSWRYKANGTASYYEQAVGRHQWYTAPSGTAGNAITFTQAMTLDASGNLGIGVTSMSYPLVVGLNGSSSTAAMVYVNPSTATNAAIQFFNNGGSGAFYIGRLNSSGGGAGSGLPAYDTVLWNTGVQNMIFGTNNAERCRIDTSGNFSLSTNATSFQWTNSGNNVALNGDSGILRFYTGTSAYNERARITAGGYFKASNAGTYVSSTSTYHELYSNASSDWIGYFTQATATSPNGVVIQYTAAAPNGTANTFIYCQDNAAVRATIRSNGGLANYQANDVNLSDQRVKKDIKPLGSMWDKFKALEIVTFKYKDQTHDDDNIGVIAQQVESVAPEFIDTDGFGETPEGEEPLKTVYTTDMYHAAIKALQEAMARIEQLEAKVAALEA